MKHSILVLLVLQGAVQGHAAESHTDTGQDLWRPNIQCLQRQAAQSTVLSHDVPLVLIAVASGMLITLSSIAHLACAALHMDLTSAIFVDLGNSFAFHAHNIHSFGRHNFCSCLSVRKAGACMPAD